MNSICTATAVILTFSLFILGVGSAAVNAMLGIERIKQGLSIYIKIEIDKAKGQASETVEKDLEEMGGHFDRGLNLFILGFRPLAFAGGFLLLSFLNLVILINFY